jgi:hypothetical protein
MGWESVISLQVGGRDLGFWDDLSTVVYAAAVPCYTTMSDFLNRIPEISDVGELWADWDHCVIYLLGATGYVLTSNCFPHTETPVTNSTWGNGPSLLNLSSRADVEHVWSPTQTRSGFWFWDCAPQSLIYPQSSSSGRFHPENPWIAHRLKLEPMVMMPVRFGLGQTHRLGCFCTYI